MARQLGLRVVAEGVERPEQVSFLRSQADVIGGGYYAKPLTLEALVQRLRKESEAVRLAS